MFIFIPRILNILKKENIEQYENQKKKVEPIRIIYLYMAGYNPNYYYKWSMVDHIILAILYFITFLISVGSAYLSYSCTWSGNMKNPLFRLIFALLAFMLGPVYLVWYFFANYMGGLC